MRQLSKLVSLLALTVMVGCATTLEPGGKYTDMTLFRADQSAMNAYKLTSAFLKWEKANRSVLPVEVMNVAKTIREQFPPGYRSYLAVRRAYIANPAGMSNQLQTALAVIVAMGSEAAKWFAPPTTTTEWERPLGVKLAAF